LLRYVNRLNMNPLASQAVALPPNVERVTRPTDSTQFYLFNLFADYIVPRGGRIWTNDLLYLLNLLGVNEQGARTTLSRMKQRGWFTTTRDGRQSQYEITAQGQAILAEGDRRIFEAPYTEWDGRWHLVVYSLPEAKRKLRTELRKKLIWLGFGNLAPGTWASPHNRRAELEGTLAALDIQASATLFTADTVSDAEIVSRCWDVATLGADYHTFVAQYLPEYETSQRQLAGDEPSLSPEQCFVHRFWLTYEFQRFPLKDPHLPVELLPDGWIGFTARQLFLDYRQLLGEGMGDFMDKVVCRSDGTGAGTEWTKG
jgi:phenylacetic acid degradation operon negative regulatory protein